MRNKPLASLPLITLLSALYNPINYSHTNEYSQKHTLSIHTYRDTPPTHTRTHTVGVVQDSFASSVSFTDSVSSPALSILSVFSVSRFTFFTVKSQLFSQPKQSLLLLIQQTVMSPTLNGGSIHINRISFSATSKCFLTSPENLSYYNAIIPSTDKLFLTSQLSFPVALCPKAMSYNEQAVLNTFAGENQFFKVKQWQSCKIRMQRKIWSYQRSSAESLLHSLSRRF